MTINARRTPRSIGQVVAELRRTYPDVSTSSLRFLEREGLIHPLRSPGGHRLFRTSDVARVRQIKEWQERRLSLAEIRGQLEAADSLSARALSQRFLECAVRGERGEAARTLLTADDLGLPLEESFGDVLAPALVEVGTRWAAGTLQVGQEHEISALAAELIAELTFRHARTTPDRPGIVAACAAHERHDLGLRVVAGLLRTRGLRLHFLGADVTPEILVESVRLRRPAIVLLSATLPAHIAGIVEAIGALRAAGYGRSIIGGGQACLKDAAVVRAAGAEVPDADNLGDLTDGLVAITGTDERD